MLEELRISALGVIDEAVLELDCGLTVVTGETGAGKTMVVTALGLLLGARADSALVRRGAPRARVEGALRVTDPRVRRRAEEAGAELDGDVLLLGRTLTPEGRSRAAVGGAAVPVGLLGELTTDLVTVHGQADQLRLLLPTHQRDYLDAFGGPELAAVLTSYATTYADREAVRAELGDVVANRRARAQEADSLRLGIAEITALAPTADEEEELRVEEQRLASADALREAAARARQALSGSAADAGCVDALGLVAEARRALATQAAADPALTALDETVASASYLLADAAADLASYAADIESDPVRLAVVTERRAALRGLTRKYGDTLAGVLAWAHSAQERLAGLIDDDSRIEALETAFRELTATAIDLAAVLTERRRAAAAELGDRVTAELAGLAMAPARFVVGVDAGTDLGPTGADEITFRLAPSGEGPGLPVARSASGGELSRIMLALEVCLAGAAPPATMVFDEVDAGVGGRAAGELGRRLARLAQTSQVLVVTHLPQVAAFADTHYVVERDSSGRVVRSGVRRLDEPGRRTELSRMLAGLEDSATAVAHAEELLAVARAARAG